MQVANSTLFSTSKLPIALNRYVNFLAFLLISLSGFAGLYLISKQQQIEISGIIGIFGLGIIGTWRWLWFGVHLLRAKIYEYIVFPFWRRKANRIAVEDLPHVCFLVPTYKEKPWISERVFLAIAKEARTLAQPITVLVNSSGEEENALIQKIIETEDPGLKHIKLYFMVQKEGKRKAMASALRGLARMNLPKDTIVALMDGDSELTPGTLRACLPFFCLFPKMGALTTDETPLVQGSYLFSEWFHLRFAQRHYQMCSVSLSKKVMCLTGRFSLFRSEAAFAPTFADILENDTLDDWLWGNFKFLSGDDKSTWYWLVQRGYDMLYIPDAIVYSIETISGSLTNRTYQNMRRWYGNMLRNSSRAIAQGPGKTGWFMWWCLIDQKYISIWTSLITPGLLIITILQADWGAAGLIGFWILFSRPLMLIVIFWGRDSLLKLLHLPMLLGFQWASSLIKIWTQMNLAQQKWANRGDQVIKAGSSGLVGVIQRNTSKLLYYIQMFSFVVFLMWLSNIINPLHDFPGIVWRSQVDVASTPIPTRIIKAIEHQVIPSDGQDDAPALQNLIDSLAGDRLTMIELPIGEIDLFRPWEINRSNVIIQGQGANRTVVKTHFDSNLAEASFFVRPAKNHKEIHSVKLTSFSLVNQSTGNSPNQLNGIVLENVKEATLEYVDLADVSGSPILLNKTNNVTVEYVATNSSYSNDPIVLSNAVNTKIKGVAPENSGTLN